MTFKFSDGLNSHTQTGIKLDNLDEMQKILLV